MREGGLTGSAWWREIVKIQNGIGVEGGSWSEESILKRLGNGFNTFFWSNCSVGTVLSMDRFRRMYDLSIHKNLSMGEMHALGWGEDGEAWGWRRRLLTWEEELVVEIRSLLTNITLQDAESDVWLWRPNIGDGYIVRGVYQMLMRQEMHNHDVVSDVPWYKSVHL